MNEQPYTIAEAAREKGVTEEAIRKAIREKRLKVIKRALTIRVVLITPEDLDNYHPHASPDKSVAPIQPI